MRGAAPAPAARGRAVLRHAAGFALAPAVAPLTLLAFELYRALGAERSAGVAAPGAALRHLASLATGLLPAGYLAALALGVPIVLALRAARRLTIPWVVGVSALAAGATAIAGMVALEGAPPGLEDLPDLALLCAMAAGLAAAVSGAHCGIAGVPLRGAEAAPPPAPATLSDGPSRGPP